jgi:hypothetical protein
MVQARERLKRVPTRSQGAVWASIAVLVIAFSAFPTPASAATTIIAPIRGVPAITMTQVTVTSSPSHHVVALARQHRAVAMVAELADFTKNPTPSDDRVVTLIHQDFPAHAWHDAEAVAWCESKFRADDIGFDSNGTHDRGLFQLNDGGTEQYLMAMIGQNPKNLNLAFNPVLNVRAAALRYARDGWSQGSCESAI